MKEDQVLAREDVDRFAPFQGMDLCFLADLRFAHFMEFFDWYCWIFLTKFDESNASVGFEGPADTIHHFVGMRKFVVDIDHQDEVDGRRPQARVGNSAEDGVDVCDAELGEAVGEQLEHFGLNIDGEHLACGADRLGESVRKVAAARTNVGHGHAQLEIKGGDD